MSFFDVISRHPTNVYITSSNITEGIVIAAANKTAQVEARRLAKAAADAAKVEKAAARKATAEERRKKALVKKAAVELTALFRASKNRKQSAKDAEAPGDDFGPDLDGSFGPARKRRNTEGGALPSEDGVGGPPEKGLPPSAGQTGEGALIFLHLFAFCVLCVFRHIRRVVESRNLLFCHLKGTYRADNCTKQA